METALPLPAGEPVAETRPRAGQPALDRRVAELKRQPARLEAHGGPEEGRLAWRRLDQVDLHVRPAQRQLAQAQLQQVLAIYAPHLLQDAVEAVLLEGRRLVAPGAERG